MAKRPSLESRFAVPLGRVRSKMVQVVGNNEVAAVRQPRLSSPSHGGQGAGPPKESLGCSVCQRLWCKYSHHSGFQGANMMPPSLELGWDVHSLLIEPYEPGPADPPCPPVFSGRQESLVMRAQAPVRLPGLKS